MYHMQKMKMRNAKARAGLLVVLLLALVCLFACGVKEEETKVKDLDYEIVEETAIPEELKNTIAEKKSSDLKLTYETADALYVVRGYGEKETGGYSISVKEFYLSKNAVYCATELIGPQKNETASNSPSYPYIVLKTEAQNKNVIFD